MLLKWRQLGAARLVLRRESEKMGLEAPPTRTVLEALTDIT